MKKIVFLLIITALTAYMFGAAFQACAAELVCDINKGTLGNLKVGGYTNEKEMVAATGENPKVDSSDFEEYIIRDYSWLSLGLFISTDTDDKGEFITDMSFSLTDVTGNNGSSCKSFKGRLLPQVSSLDDIDSIKEKFGPPDYTKMHLPEYILLTYKKPYGVLDFQFNKEGQLTFLKMATSEY